MKSNETNGGCSAVLSTAGLGCGRCHGTGIVRYKELDEFAFRQWVPWQEMSCPNGCMPNLDKQSNAKLTGLAPEKEG